MCQLAVLQNAVDDGVVRPELFQHLRAGGVARFRLLHRRQAHVLKQDLAQLLSGVEVKFLPGHGPDLPLQGGDAGFELLSKVGQGIQVHQHPGLLHLGQNRAEGQLQLLIDPVKAQLRQLVRQHVIQRRDENGVAGHGPHGLGCALCVLPGFAAPDSPCPGEMSR